jgi:hypothetical protein
MSKLVTFGDSFVAQLVYYKKLEPRSWLDVICRENNFVLDGCGLGGNGIWTTIMDFLNYEKDFDVCIFGWSTLHREMDIRKENDDSIFLKGIALLQWFDRFLQKNYSDKKIIHLYCFKEQDKLFDIDILIKNDISFDFYPHIFNQGVNIKPELLKFSKLLDFKLEHDDRTLHMAPQVHKSFGKQLNEVLKDKSLKNGDIVEFNLGY